MPSFIITIIRFISAVLSIALAAHFSDGAWHLFGDADEHMYHGGFQGNLIAIAFFGLGLWILLLPLSPILPILTIILALIISSKSLLTFSELNGIQYRAIILVVLTTVLIIASKPNLDGS